MDKVMKCTNCKWLWVDVKDHFVKINGEYVNRKCSRTYAPVRDMRKSEARAFCCCWWEVRK